MNYNDHSAEAARWGKENFVRNEGKAVYFGKRAAVIIGPDDDIDGHFDIVDSLDYEAELAVVLGSDAYGVAYEDASDYVLGYSVFNDISARNLQKDHKQFYFGKSLDTHTAMGPWIVTKDELPWPPEYNIRCFVNGEKRQDSNTRNMIFDVAYVISELSRGMTLKAGTIIAMGTPAGVGMGFDPPKYLKTGDLVRCEIDGIGMLENKVK
jgi:2-keto-4-pentenoate hydratase/2-oxohepta-3-ene-1,7-dioic acid hydratase in catechol pathway